MPRDFDEIKKLASLPTQIVPLCLAGELVAEITRLERQLERTPKPTSLGDSSRRVIAEQILAVQEQMRESTVEFHLQAMGPRVWSRFWANQPTRKEPKGDQPGESDEEWEARAFPFYAELVARSCVDPPMSTEQVGELCDLLHTSAWNRLATACIRLNTDEVDVPNSVAASELIGNSEQT